MNSTIEQQTIISHVASAACTPLTLIDSIAGSGKTTLLVAIANALPHTNGLYLAYNNSVAKEATQVPFHHSLHDNSRSCIPRDS